MNKPWVAYLSSVLFLAAGVFQLMAGKYLPAVLFIIAGIASVIVNIILYKKKNQ